MPKQLEQVEIFAHSPERRRSARYPIAGTVSVRWKAPDGQWHHADGVTRNIGKDGVFIVCESGPNVASTVQLVVTLPTHSRAHGPVCLRGTGNVRHLQRDSMRAIGFGAGAEFQLELPMSAGQPH